MFVLNVIELSATAHELSWVHRKKTQTNTIQSVATARMVKIQKITAFRQHQPTSPAVDRVNKRNVCTERGIWNQSLQSRGEIHRELTAKRFLTIQDKLFRRKKNDKCFSPFTNSLTVSVAYSRVTTAAL